MVDGGLVRAVAVLVLAVLAVVVTELIVPGMVVMRGGHPGGRAVGDDAPLGQDDCARDDVGQLSHLVQDRHQGESPGVQVGQDGGQGLARGAVDAGQRLVEQQQLG